MNWDILFERVPDVLVSGGVVYMIVQSLLTRRKYKAEVNHMKGENKAQDVETSGKVIDVYKEVQTIVDAKVEPIQRETKELRKELTETKASLARTLAKLEDLEKNWVCYNSTCSVRIRKRPCDILTETLNDVTDEAKSYIQ